MKKVIIYFSVMAASCMLALAVIWLSVMLFWRKRREWM